MGRVGASFKGPPTATDIRHYCRYMDPTMYEFALKGIMWFDPVHEVGCFIVETLPTNGSSGSLAGIAAPPSRLIHIGTQTTYVNTGTKASPTWTKVADGYY